MRHSPSYAVARLHLASSEPVRVEAGAMLATSFGVTVEGRAHGGLRRSLARAAAGDQFFVATYTAPDTGGWVDVAPALPGDVHVVELDGAVAWCVTRGSWLAGAAAVTVEARWTGFRGLFGSDSGFLLHAAGIGPLVVACCGALDVVTLQPGELMTVDAGHVVGYADTVQSRLRPMVPGGQQSLRSGEGLVFDFAGPGQVLTQTRDPRDLLGWLAANGVATRA